MAKKNYIKAEVALVSIGHLEVEGLLTEDGVELIAQQQVASLFSVIPTSTPKWLKRLLENDFQLFSLTSSPPWKDGDSY